MDELGWEIGRGWKLSPGPDTVAPIINYRLTSPTGWWVDIQIDRAIPKELAAVLLGQSIAREMARGVLLMDHDAVYGGGDVRPEPDGA